MSDSINLCENINDCLATLAWNRYAAVAVSRKYASSSPAISNDQIYCFDRRQNIRSISISMVTRHDLDYLTKINRLLQYSVESGLFLKWERDSRSQIDKDDSSTIVYHRITWEHLAGGMIVITIGLAVSSCVFVLELFVKRMRRIHRRSKYWKVTERLIDGHRYELL